MKYCSDKVQHAEDEGKRDTFPFRWTPSGHLKVEPNQVVFNTKKVSVLVAEPNNTKISLAKELEKKKFKNMPPIPSKLFQAPQVQMNTLA